MAFAGLQALLDTADTECEDTRVLAIFDNEETGSGTKQEHIPRYCETCWSAWPMPPQMRETRFSEPWRGRL